MIEAETTSGISARFLRVFRAKRVRLALATLLVGLLVLVIPELEAVQEELMILITTLLLAFVGDGVRVARNGKGNHDTDGLEEEGRAENMT